VIENPHNSSHLPDKAAIETPAAMVPPVAASSSPLESEPSHAHGQPAAEAADSNVAPVAEEHSKPVAEKPVAEKPVAEELVAEEPEAEEPVAEAVEEEERGPIEETPVVDEPPKMNWYILKVQSNREESIREGLQRRVAVAGLERYFGDIIVPTEMVSEFKGGKKRVVKRKLYPGYLVVNMEINEETWFLVRETPGIGDFTGAAGHPTPMLPHEVSRILARQEEKSEEAPRLKINFNTGDRVKINDGTFENFEGEVDAIDQTNGRVTVMINIFGRSTPVELEYWQIEAL
jgi:transcriptional antiterminator NusG